MVQCETIDNNKRCKNGATHTHDDGEQKFFVCDDCKDCYKDKDISYGIFK